MICQVKTVLTKSLLNLAVSRYIIDREKTTWRKYPYGTVRINGRDGNQNKTDNNGQRQSIWCLLS